MLQSHNLIELIKWPSTFSHFISKPVFLCCGFLTLVCAMKNCMHVSRDHCIIECSFVDCQCTRFGFWLHSIFFFCSLIQCFINRQTTNHLVAIQFFNSTAKKKKTKPHQIVFHTRKHRTVCNKMEIFMSRRCQYLDVDA